MSERLIEAAEEGDVARVARLLKNPLVRVQINRGDENDMRPVIAAAAGGHTAVVELLIDKGADANRVDQHGWPALAHAVRGGYTGTVQSLLGARPNAYSLGQGVVQAADMSRENPECLKLLELLLKAGGDPNAMDGGEAFPALYLAVQEESMDAVRMLLDAGAHPDRGRSAEGPGENIVDYMNGGWTTLLRAVMDRPMELIELLLDRGANPNIASSAFRKTALMQAAEWGRPDVIRLLVERGADLDTISPAWGTALSVACYEEQEPCVATLLELGADARLRWESTMGRPESAADAARGVPAIEALLAGRG